MSNENKPMTAEEILRKYPVYQYLKEVGIEQVLKAMHEFASQTPKVSEEEIRKMALEKYPIISVTKSRPRFPSQTWEEDLNEEKRRGFIEGIRKGLSMQQSDAVEWISVKDRLPERGIAVNVVLTNGLVTVAYLKKQEKAWQLFGDIESICNLKNESIIYWQKLPLFTQSKKEGK